MCGEGEAAFWRKRNMNGSDGMKVRRLAMAAFVAVAAGGAPTR